MIYKCVEFGDKEFSSKDEMFSHLLKNKDNLIRLKKAQIQKSYDKGQISWAHALKFENQSKSAINMSENCIYPVINTTNYMDSHNDVHFPGIWTKSIQEQQGNIFYVLDHKLDIDKVIAWSEDVNAFVADVPWSFVGKSYPGSTQALIFEINKNSIVNESAKQMIELKRPVQNSIRMGYVKIQFGVNDIRPEFKAQKDYYDSKIGLIANRDEAEAIGYFWGIEEAKIIKEGSMVLFGSNDATPIQYLEAEDDTSKKDPPESSQKNSSIYSLFI